VILGSLFMHSAIRSPYKPHFIPLEFWGSRTSGHFRKIGVQSPVVKPHSKVYIRVKNSLEYLETIFQEVDPTFWATLV